jgi:flagellin
MAISIITNTASLAAQSSLNAANEAAISSATRLSSGNAISKPSDDVSGLAVGTILQTTVDSLRAALRNTAQASSLLNVADGALDNIQKMLSRQNVLANQATSGALDSVSRSYLNAEFQALTTQIDLTSNTTNFNKIKLLDGSLYNKSAIVTDTNSVRDVASASLTVTDLSNSKTVTVNGVTFTARTTLLNDGSAEFVASATPATAAANFVNALNTFNDERLKNMTYSVSGAVVTFTSKTMGLAGNMFSIGKSSDTAAFTNGAVPEGYTGAIATLSNSSMEIGGLSESNVEIKGQINDNILKDLSAVKASGSIALNINTTSIATAANNEVTFATGSVTTGTGASANYAVVHMDHHGFKTGDTINSTNGAAWVKDGLTFADATDYTVTVIDRNHFKLLASSGTTTAGGVVSTADFIATINHEININGSTIVFKSSPSAANEVAIGTTNAETAANLLQYLNKSTDANIASATYALNSAKTGIDITYKDATANGNNFYVTSPSTLITSTLSADKTLQNGASTGIDVSGITNNEAFIGTLGSFKATYAGSTNTANLTVEVGDFTYSASNVNTNPTADTTIKFISNTDTDTNLNGGSFTIDLAMNKGETVNNDTDAQRFADRISSAFQNITLNQRREISSYTGIGNVSTNGVIHGRLDGTKFVMNTNTYQTLEVASFSVIAPVDSTANGTMMMTVNGENYSTRDITQGLILPGQYITLSSETNPLNSITFYNNADIEQDFSTSDRAVSFSTAMQKSLGLNQGKSSLNFQIGTTTEESMSLSIQGTTTANIFKDATGTYQNLDISTSQGAQTAIEVLGAAIQNVTTIRANIGALQSRMDKAASTIETGIRNQDAARSIFLDTDMSAEPTNFASAQVQEQAAIAVLAQTNLLAQYLLKLLG